MGPTGMEYIMDGLFDESAMFEEISPEDAKKMWGIDLQNGTFEEMDDPPAQLPQKRKRKKSSKKKRKKPKRAFRTQLDDSRTQTAVNVDAWKEFQLHDKLLANIQSLGKYACDNFEFVGCATLRFYKPNTHSKSLSSSCCLEQPRYFWCS